MWGRFPKILLFVTLSGCLSMPQREVQELNKEGIQHLSQREYAQAQISFTKAAELAPQDADVIYHLATASHYSGDLTKAEKSYRACLALDPYHAKCRHGFTVLLLQQDKSKEAWQMT